MLRRISYTVPILFLLGGSVLWAADFWEKKKFSEWTLKEVQEMVFGGNLEI